MAQRIPNKPLALVFSLVLMYTSVRMLRYASREIRNGGSASATGGFTLRT